MKKIIFSVIALGLSAAAMAQNPITLTSVDIAYIGKEVKQATDSMPAATIVPGAAGTNLTWNFSNMAQHTVDTLVFTNPNWTAAASDFPSATVAVSESSGSTVYINNSFTSATILGIYTDPGLGTPVPIKTTPPEILMNWPATYGSNFSQNFENKSTFYYGQDPGIGFTIDSVRLKQTVTKIDSIDAWGSMTTPLGTYDVLRVKEWRHTIDSVDFYVQMFGGWVPAFQNEDTTMMYQWWANNVGFPLVEVDVTITGDTVTEARWLKAIPSSTSINEQTVEVSIYPNPATNSVTFETGLSGAAFITVYDAAGRRMESVSVKTKSTSVNTSSFAPGMYLYSITGVNGQELSRGNFNVVR